MGNHPCDKCDLKTTWKQSLKYHIKSIHEGDNRLVTNVTINKATRVGSLLAHIKSKHEGVIYPCNLYDIKQHGWLA